MRLRFHPVARRIFIAPAAGLALAAAITACSSSSGSSSSSTTPTAAATSAASSPAASSTPAGSSSPGTGSAATVATIKKNWETFFNGKTPAATKVSLVQNGQKFASVINSMAGSSLAQTASASVKSVTVTSPTQATVKYSILVSGTPVLQGQTGTAVYENGTWKVGTGSFCALLTLQNGGKAPAGCSSAS
jgi:hypothetical protein